MLDKLLQALEQEPNNPFYIYGIAIEYRNQGKLDQAYKYFKQAYEKCPDYLPNYYHYGQILTDRDQIEEARKIFEVGIQLADQQNNGHAKSELLAALNQIQEL